MRERDVQRARAVQVGPVDEVLPRVLCSRRPSAGTEAGSPSRADGVVDSNYEKRYSHAKVSRWESGGTRLTLQRLKVFGQALNLSHTDVAGLVLLAGLAPDFPTALGLVSGSNGANGNVVAPGPGSGPEAVGIAVALGAESTPSSLRCALQLVLRRVLLLGVAGMRFRYGYKGRSHSLWFCNAVEPDVFRWYETAFMRLFGESQRDVAPFAMSPGGRDVANALTVLHTYQVAWPFTPTDQGDEEEFIDRWIEWFANAVQGELRYPSRMPERSPQGSWRRGALIVSDGQSRTQGRGTGPE